MNYWDSFREIQRLLENLRPIEDQIRAYKQIGDRLQQASVSMMPAADLLLQFEITKERLRLPAELVETRDTISAAIRSLPDISRLTHPIVDLSYPLQLIERVNIAIREARFIAELEIADEETHPSESDLAQKADAQLVEVVPPEVLDALRRVEFAPLVLLDRALRDPNLIRAIGARDFEGFVATLVEQLGFEDVILTPRSGDGGRDVLAKKQVNGIAMLFAFECKRYAPHRPVGPEIARALLGTIMHKNTRATRGILVTTSFFTPAAHKFILTEPALEGKDFNGIVDWLKEYSSKRRHLTQR